MTTTMTVGGAAGVGDDDAVQPAGEVPAGSVEVQIVHDDADAFQPGTITIDVGQSVTWVNLDDDDHTATSAGFDTGIIRPGGLATVTFSDPGTFVYSCQIHPEMVGRVEVRGADGIVPASASPEASPQATPVASPIASAEVAIVDIAFDPAQLEISVGTTVTWTNQDPVPHSATASEGTFDSGILNEGGTFRYTFDAAGTFEYVCVVHSNMRASITVADGSFIRRREGRIAMTSGKGIMRASCHDEREPIMGSRSLLP